VTGEAVRLTGMVVCQNEAARIGACLESLDFCDEIVVVDSGSTDATLEIVRRMRKVRLFERPFVSMNDQKEYGRESSRGTWLLNLDADEVVSPPLKEEVLRVIAAAPGRIAAYRIPFRNHFRSVWVKRSGYYPDPHVRLVLRERARWDREVPVHDVVRVEGEIGSLGGHVDHYSFDSISDFIAKSCDYAERFARRAHAEGQRAGWWTIAAHTLARFIKAYVLKAGFLEGALGITISGLQAYEVFQKYIRLWELGRFGPGDRGAAS
jgi:glycosyltransferase involved in cell wall biosynthesis